MTPARRSGDEDHGRIARWFRAPVGGPTWLSVIIVLCFVAVAPAIVGAALYERQVRLYQRQASQLTNAVAENRATLGHVCSTESAIEHLDRFFLGLAQKPQKGETSEQRRVRIAFIALVGNDLKTLARAAKACAALGN